MLDILVYFVGLIIAVCLFWFLLILTDAWRLNRLRKKYNESKDLSKQGEQARKQAGGVSGDTSDGGFTEGEFTPQGSNRPERREFLQTTAPKPLRENSTSFRVSNNFRY